MRGQSGICRQSLAALGGLKPGSLKLGMLKMKSKTRLVRGGDRRLSGNEQVRREIQRFLHAMKSYPGRFASDPRITFAEHHCGVVRAAASTVSRRRV